MSIANEIAINHLQLLQRLLELWANQVSPYNHSQKNAKYYWADKDLHKAADAAVAAQVSIFSVDLVGPILTQFDPILIVRF